MNSLSYSRSIGVYLAVNGLTCDVVEVVAIQIILKCGDPHRQHILVFGGQKLPQL